MLTWWWSPHICKMVRKQPVFGKGIPSGYSFHGGFVCRNLSTPFRCFFVPKVKEGNIQKNLVCLGQPFSQRHALLHKGSVIQGKGDSYRFVVSPPVWTHIFDDEMQLQLMHSWIHVHFVKPRPKPTSTGSFLDTYTTDCHILWISRVWCKMVFLLDSHGCSSRPNHPNLIFEQLSRNSQSTPFEVLNKPTVTGVTQKNVYKILSHIYIYRYIFNKTSFLQYIWRQVTSLSSGLSRWASSYASWASAKRPNALKAEPKRYLGATPHRQGEHSTVDLPYGWWEQCNVIFVCMKQSQNLETQRNAINISSIVCA